MALEDQIVSIDMGMGIDTKTAPQQVMATSLTTCDNRVFTKDKQLKKDFGYDRLSRALFAGGSLSSGEHETTFNDELLKCTTDTLYAYSETAAQWLNRGKISSVELSSDSVVENNYNQTNSDVQLMGSYLVYSWIDFRGGVRASVKDTIRNVFILTDVSLNTTAVYQQSVKLSSTTVGIYYVDGTTIKYKTWSTASPAAFSGESTLVSGLSSTPYIFDLTTDGTTIAAAYVSSGLDLVIAKLSTAGAISSSATVTVGEAIESISLVIESSGANIFCAFYRGGATEAYQYVVRSVSSLTSVLAITAIDINDAGESNKIVGVSTGTNAVTFYYQLFSPRSTYDQFRVYSATTNSAGTVGTPAQLHLDVVLASKPFTINSIRYVVLRGAFSLKTDPRNQFLSNYLVRLSDGFVELRFLTEVAGDADEQIVGNFNVGYAPKVEVLTSTTALFPALKITQSNATGSGITPIRSLKAITFDFATPKVRQSVQANQNTIISGGVTHSYDGAIVTELGFHNVASVVFDDAITTTDQYFLVLTPQQGTAGLPEISTITINAPADYIEGRSGLDGQYFVFDTTADDYYVWFRVNGLGDAPAPGTRTGIPVDITGRETKEQLAKAIQEKLSASSLAATVTSSSNVVTITNTVNGNVPDITNVNVMMGAIAPGNYQYRAIYEWIDNAGQVHRSSPSIVYQNGSSTSSLSVNGFPTAAASMLYTGLSLTQKNNSTNVPIVKIYRTKESGSIFYLVSSSVTPLLASVNEYTRFFDVLSDDEIGNREQLYTTGDIIENDPPPASTALVVAKNRVWLVDQEEDQVWYSKQISQGFGVSFSAAFTDRIDSKEDSITAIGEMDEKIIVFKDRQPFLILGEGPNDAGLGGSFTSPEPIICPVGCSEKNSVIRIPDGLLFKSRKGIYLLDRGLNASYVGAPVEDYNSATIISASLLSSVAQIRFLTNANTYLIYDYDFRQWSRRTLSNLGTVRSACIWKNTYVIGISDGYSWQQSSSLYQDNSNNYATTIETGWLRVASLQGFQRVRRLLLLAEYQSAHNVVVSIGYNYSTTYDASDVYTFTPSGSAGSPLQMEIHLRIQKCEALRIKVTETAVAGNLLEGNRLLNLSARVGVKKGSFKLAAANKL